MTWYIRVHDWLSAWVTAGADPSRWNSRAARWRLEEERRKVDLSGEPVISQLPWRHAAEAAAHLTSRDRRALEALRAIVREAYTPDALETASTALAQLVRAPLGVVAAGDPVQPGRTVGSTRSAVVDDDALWSRVGAGRAYDPGKKDDFANRPVNTSTLACRYPERASGFHSIWGHLDVVYQLRTVVADDTGFLGYVGVWRAPRDGAFDVVEHARMAAAIPSIAELLLATRALRSANGRGFAATLDAFDQCAYLLRGRTIAYANRAARTRCPAAPEWLCCASAKDLQGVKALASVVQLEIDGVAYRLVIPRSAPLDAGPLEALSPALRRVAELMADGWSDKEIAELTGYTVSTARTFATRVLARLGLNGRGQLVRLVRGR